MNEGIHTPIPTCLYTHRLALQNSFQLQPKTNTLTFDCSNLMFIHAAVRACAKLTYVTNY